MGLIGVLDDEWLASYEQILRHGFIQEDAVTIAKWLLLSEHKQTSLQPFKFAIESNWWEKLRIYQDEENQAYKTSTLLQTTLRPYQQKGFEWLSLLAEMGLAYQMIWDLEKQFKRLPFSPAELINKQMQKCSSPVQHRATMGK